MNIDLATMEHHNLRHLASGELAVRPGFRRLYTPLVGRKISAAFSVKMPFVEELRHYIVDHSTTAVADPKIRILDEDFNEWQVHSLYGSKVPEAISLTLVLDQVIISSPDFATVWGIAGSGLVTATKEPSVHTALTVLDVPKGISVNWDQRCVIADGPVLYFSDQSNLAVGSPRTFTGANTAIPGGHIYGLHVTAGGSLVICTTEGVFAMPETAGMTSTITLDIQKLSNHRTLEYNSTCVAKSRLYALTARGYAIVDTDTSQEDQLDEAYQPRSYFRRVQRPDWRKARIVETEAGPIISDEIGAFHSIDIPNQQRSWQILTHDQEDSKIRATLRRRDGEELIVTEQAIYRWIGNFDGEQALTSENATTVQGVANKPIPAPPQTSPTLRHIQAGADNTSGNILIAHRAKQLDGQAPGTQRGLKIGTSDWDAGSTFDTPALRSIRKDFADQTDDLALEVGAENPLTRLNPTCEVQFKGINPKRPTDR